LPRGFGIFEGVQEDLRKNLAGVLERIERAAVRSGRKAGDIKLVAVSKTHPAEVLRDALAVGISVFGENKVQEAESKIVETGRNTAEWHLIGHLQSNKARKAVQLFDVIQSLDSVELAERLERICLEGRRKALHVFIQVDLAGEETKSGIAEKDLPSLVDFLQGCKYLKLHGLMIVPPYFENPEDARPFFVRLREIRDELISQSAFASGKGELSMGMSHDFEIAVEEGATIVRVGTAIFGKRERV
jgi:pyridoxal phosphate enzyme, YggS family